PGAILCFTGEARDPENGSPIERSELEDLAVGKGLRSEPSLTKSRTDALIVAEFGTQSSKAKKARQWDKPIFSVEEFLHWVNGTTSTSDEPAGVSIDVVVETLSAADTALQRSPSTDEIAQHSSPLAEVVLPKSEASETISEA